MKVNFDILGLAMFGFISFFILSFIEKNLSAMGIITGIFIGILYTLAFIIEKEVKEK